jgi:aspartyl-tRNA(Asn)/glutamyl-tRNA(Gln) amidotransferase subunit C
VKKLTVDGEPRILKPNMFAPDNPGDRAVMISPEHVEHVAQLARLALQPEEKQRFTAQLNAILTYMEQLNAVPTEGVEPTAHVLDLVNVFRDDMVRQTLSAAAALANAPEAAQQYFVVPRIIE